jgi:hypothetical protein
VAVVWGMLLLVRANHLDGEGPRAIVSSSAYGSPAAAELRVVASCAVLPDPLRLGMIDSQNSLQIMC